MIKFIKRILNGFIESWAGFKEDEHIEMYKDINEYHCSKHSRFRKSCPECKERIN